VKVKTPVKITVELMSRVGTTTAIEIVGEKTKHRRFQRYRWRR